MATVIDIGDALQNDSATLRLPRMTPDEFWEFCQRNSELNVERTAEGDIVFCSPTGSSTGRRNSELTRQLGNWAVAHEDLGFAFDSSTLFTLPNGAVRSPDAAWLRADRWNALSSDEQERPAPICPDFVVELMSPSDTLAATQAKMDEYLANGVRLGWLLDRKNKRIYVYHPGRPVEELTNPATISGDPELRDFALNLARIFLKRAE